jgi:hypothetical protein
MIDTALLEKKLAFIETCVREIKELARTLSTAAAGAPAVRTRYHGVAVGVTTHKYTVGSDSLAMPASRASPTTPTIRRGGLPASCTPSTGLLAK